MPLLLGTRGKGEGEQDERDTRADKQQTDDVELLREHPNTPAEGGQRALGAGRGDEPKALCLLLGPEEGDDEGREGGRDEDGEHAVSPTPAGPLEDLRRDVGADEGVDDERCGGEARDETSPLEGGDIGHNDGRQELQSSTEMDDQLALCVGTCKRRWETYVYPLDEIRHQLPDLRTKKRGLTQRIERYLQQGHRHFVRTG